MTRRYSAPATPCDRLLGRHNVSEEAKGRLHQNRAALDQVSLLHSIRKSQTALRAINVPGSGACTVETALRASFPNCPTCGDGARSGRHTPKTRKYRTRVPHTWRTRPDPFEGVCSLILDWLQKQPDVGGRGADGSAHTALL